MTADLDDFVNIAWFSGGFALNIKTLIKTSTNIINSSDRS